MELINAFVNFIDTLPHWLLWTVGVLFSLHALSSAWCALVPEPEKNAKVAWMIRETIERLAGNVRNAKSIGMAKKE